MARASRFFLLCTRGVRYESTVKGWVRVSARVRVRVRVRARQDKTRQDKT